ncbi:MAG: hypothetical protein LC772_02570, partial [Chloroflexi bacterium]|nr:hypothetical protein [Chloroflexota bacterium]
LYRAPFLNEGLGPFPAARAAGDSRYSSLRMPVCELACEEAVWLNQRMLLSSSTQIQAIIDAVSKVYEHRAELEV